MRLARTEINMAYRYADYERWKDMDFVLGIKIQLSDAHPKYDICDVLQGEYPKDFKFGGWHPHCLCFATPILQSDKDFIAGKQPKPIKELPQNFKDWYEFHKDQIQIANEKGKLPYFLRDNKFVFENNNLYIKSDNTIIGTIPKSPLEIAKERHKERTLKQIQDIKQKWNRRKTSLEKNSTLARVCQKAEENKIIYNDVQFLTRKLSGDEIIARISGGDTTLGSCSSLAFAYAGNRAGYDVLDFRGGKSTLFFVDGKNILTIAKAVGGKYKRGNVEKATEVLTHVKQGKEYYFAIAQHATIIRKNSEGKIEFLELQSSISNGWKRLTIEKLKDRFKADYFSKKNTVSFLIDIKLLKKNFGFRKMLGYINTNVNEQKKGNDGTIK